MQHTVLFCLFFTTLIYAQDHDKSEEPHENYKKHAISAALSHTHINNGVKDGETVKWEALPSFALNYNFNITDKWAIGIHNDIIIEEFEVESKDENKQTTKRTRPVASAIMVSYKAYKHLVLMTGGGMEFSKEEDFGLVRLGLEFPFEIPGEWEIFGALTWDININAYNSVNMGIGITKLF